MTKNNMMGFVKLQNLASIVTKAKVQRFSTQTAMDQPFPLSKTALANVVATMATYMIIFRAAKAKTLERPL